MAGIKRLLTSFLRYIQRFFTSVNFGDLVRNQKAQVLDVRTNKECEDFGCIQDSINIPLENLRLELSKLDKDKPLIICCGNGMRSGLARQILLNAGFKAVYRGGSVDGLKRKLKASA